MHPTIPTRSEPEPAAPAPHSLSEGIAALLQRPVSRAVRRRAALHVLDWVGCAIAGRAATPGELFARYGTARGAGPCHAIGVGRLEAAAAAFVNGAYGNVLEMDDIHRTSVLHPGPVVIPAALANDSAFGLGSAVFGGSEQIADRLHGARVVIEEGPLYQDPHLIVGGVGEDLVIRAEAREHLRRLSVSAEFDATGATAEHYSV